MKVTCNICDRSIDREQSTQCTDNGDKVYECTEQTECRKIRDRLLKSSVKNEIALKSLVFEGEQNGDDIELNFNNLFSEKLGIKYTDLKRDKIQYRDACTHYHAGNVKDVCLPNGNVPVYFSFTYQLFRKKWETRIYGSSQMRYYALG